MDEILRAASRWIKSLPVSRQQDAAAYYGVASFSMRAFDLDFGSDRLRAAGGWFFPYYDLDNNIFRAVASQLGQPRFDFILAKISLPSLRFADMEHSVSLKIDGKTNVIYHQDPQGDEIRSTLTEKLNTIFPEHAIIDLKVQQQRDMYSCALIANCNIVAFAKGEEPDPDIDEKLIGTRAFHAPHFLNAWHRLANRQVAEIVALPEQNHEEYSAEAWQSVAETVVRRDTGLLQPEISKLTDMFEFLFRLAPNHCVPAGK